jgi:hypothetical protein
MKKYFWCIIMALVMMFGWSDSADAGLLQERLNQFPSWTTFPPLHRAQGDLYYPNWFAGEWTVTSTLVERVAPLAPDLETPGFTASQTALNQPVKFRVRFQPEPLRGIQQIGPLPTFLQPLTGTPQIIADRAFNGLNASQAILGETAISSVRLDPKSPNRQWMDFQDGRALLSTITDRAIESESPDTFISSEFYQQEFLNAAQIYLNQVENTIAYQQDGDEIIADQVTAIYLSPQDPDYFKAKGQPVALYRYQLRFAPIDRPRLLQ